VHEGNGIYKTTEYERHVEYFPTPLGRGAKVTQSSVHHAGRNF